MAEIVVYQDRNGAWVAKVTITHPNWDWKPYEIPPKISRMTEPKIGRSVALLAANVLICEMEATGR
jgi:hypothetical protein